MPRSKHRKGRKKKGQGTQRPATRERRTYDPARRPFPRRMDGAQPVSPVRRDDGATQAQPVERSTPPTEPST